jgi:hypothetical protein
MSTSCGIAEVGPEIGCSGISIDGVLWISSCSYGRMGTCRRALIAVAWMLPMGLVSPLGAQEQLRPPTAAHVRPLGGDARDLVTEGRARSALIRNLIDRLEASDLVVYVDVQWFQNARTGRLAFVGKVAGIRYAIIQIACGQITLGRLEALGHELRHAVEVADEAEVVDRQSFARYYARIGIDVGGSGPSRQFETEAAIAAGRRTRGELFATSEAQR